mmetsp:Transcript_123564/g.357329  ORF Transcript_123564/g.357329 Transcript_123564/m.357329 type:complete len:221 (-) Transcript_123564:8-670(-)
MLEMMVPLRWSWRCSAESGQLRGAPGANTPQPCARSLSSRRAAPGARRATPRPKRAASTAATPPVQGPPTASSPASRRDSRRGRHWWLPMPQQGRQAAASAAPPAGRRRPAPGAGRIFQPHTSGLRNRTPLSTRPVPLWRRGCAPDGSRQRRWCGGRPTKETVPAPTQPSALTTSAQVASPQVAWPRPERALQRMPACTWSPQRRFPPHPWRQRGDSARG